MIDNLMNSHLLGVVAWKWTAIVVALITIPVIQPITEFLISKIKLIIKSKVKTQFINLWLDVKVEKPISWILIGLLLLLNLDPLELPQKTHTILTRMVELMIYFHGVYLVYKSVDALGALLLTWLTNTKNTPDNPLVPFAVKSFKITTVVLGFLLTLQSFGVNVASLLAGLGIGGLALALAAQETLSNVFGSITILIDGPFKIGDHIKIGNLEGTVEGIGFRSTRVRTFYNSLVTLPNATVAKEQIDNLGVRPARRLRHTLGIHYDTSIEKIDQFCDGIKYLLKQLPESIGETIYVNFVGYGDSSLNILMNVHIHAVDIHEELKIQQKINVEILKLARKIGVEFAYPTRTIYNIDVKN